MINDKLYDALAKIQRLVLPILSAIFTFCVVMGDTWGFTFPVEQIAATLTALDALLGAILAILNAQYKKAMNAQEAIVEAREDYEEGGMG